MTSYGSDLILARLQGLHPKTIDLSLGRIERLSHIQSDHFPILISLCRSDRAPHLQEAPEATVDDHADAREALEAAP